MFQLLEESEKQTIQELLEYQVLQLLIDQKNYKKLMLVHCVEHLKLKKLVMIILLSLLIAKIQQHVLLF